MYDDFLRIVYSTRPNNLDYPMKFAIQTEIWVTSTSKRKYRRKINTNNCVCVCVWQLEMHKFIVPLEYNSNITVDHCVINNKYIYKTNGNIMQLVHSKNDTFRISLEICHFLSNLKEKQINKTVKNNSQNMCLSIIFYWFCFVFAIVLHVFYRARHRFQ